MIPKGSAWQIIRQYALLAIPPDTSVSIAHPSSLSGWQASGYYRVTQTAKKGFDLEVHSVDLGAALLSDAENLFDSASEHQALMWRCINHQEWMSPAWLAVTSYYWAFFLLLAMTRLMGRSAWYLGSEPVRNLVKMASMGSSTPGQGCFWLEVGAEISATERQCFLRKRGGRMHDELWRHWHTICANELIPSLTGTANSIEDRLYTAIVRTNNILGPEWPSSFRNAVNYRPGFAYSGVRRTRMIAAYSYLKKPITYSLEGILGSFEGRVASIHPGDIDKSPEVVAKLLMEYTFLIRALATELYEEVIDRRRIDTRWHNARIRFHGQNGLVTSAGTWPT